MTRIVKIRTPQASLYYGLPIGAELDLDNIIYSNPGDEYRELKSSAPAEALENFAATDRATIRASGFRIAKLAEQLRDASRALQQDQDHLRWVEAVLAERRLEEASQ